jgi:zinc transport system substrate-binding protein
MAAQVLEALVALDQEAGGETYRANYEALIAEIDALFGRLREEFRPLAGRAVFVYHPSFGYFLDEFGLVQEAVESGGKEPTPRELEALIQRAKEERPLAIFVQAQFPVEAARTVADATGATLVSLDPLSPDWLGNIEIMAKALKDALRAGAVEEAQ